MFGEAHLHGDIQGHRIVILGEVLGNLNTGMNSLVRAGEVQGNARAEEIKKVLIQLSERTLRH